jgi:hypothetical protein
LQGFKFAGQRADLVGQLLRFRLIGCDCLLQSLHLISEAMFADPGLTEQSGLAEALYAPSRE